MANETVTIDPKKLQNEFILNFNEELAKEFGDFQISENENTLDKNSRNKVRADYDKAGCNFSKGLQELINKEELLAGAKSEKKVVDFKHPEELKKLLRLEPSQEGQSNSELLSKCEDIIKYSVKTGNTFFLNQLMYGIDPYGVSAAWLTEALNTSEYTYEVAPVFVLITDYVVKRLTKLAGYEDGDGIFVPGGSMANIMALSLARYNYSKDIKKQGMFGFQRLVVFTSEASHYSTGKAAAFLGFGMDNLVLVKTDDKGCMLIDDLKEKVKSQKEKGHVPIAVLATSGTTVLGAFDDLEGVADVCEEHGLWMHVDSCWGGAVLFSSQHRHLMKGVERSDSFCISLHKLMGVPQQCAPLLTKKKDILNETFSFGAGYLFQQDKFYDVSYDMGDKTIQCGRKPDAFKFWLIWQARGDSGMEAHVNSAFSLARSMEQKVRNAEGFRLIMPEFQCTNVGFWYIPPSMRDQPETEEWWQQLHKVAAKIKERMMKKGSMMITYTQLPSKNFVNFFRLVIESPRVTEKDLDFIIQEIDELGRDL